MHVGHLLKLISPFRKIVNAADPTGDSRKLYIGPRLMSAKTAWAFMEMDTPFTTESDIVVNGQAFLSVLESLPEGNDIEFSCTDDALSWKTNTRSKGKFGLLGKEAIQRTTLSFIGAPQLPCGDDFWGEAFDLGSLATSGNVKLSSVGLNSAILCGDGNSISVVSSDNITMAYYHVDVPGLTGKWFLSPQGADLLSELSERDGDLVFSDRAIQYGSDDLICNVALVPPMNHDLLATLEPFTHGELKVALDKEQVSNFIRRVKKLTEKGDKPLVMLGTEGGFITLEFASASNESSEYILTENLPKDLNCRMPVEADRLAKALSKCDKVVVDFIDRKVLVFQSTNFQYMLSSPGSRS